MTYGVFTPAPDLTWGMKEPAAVLDYTLIVDGSASTSPRVATVADCSEVITGASLAISPGGELIPSALSVSGGAIGVWLSGGVPGRQYNVAITATTASRTYEWLIGIVCDPALATWPLPDPVTPGFGTPIIYQASDDAAFLTVGG